MKDEYEIKSVDDLLDMIEQEGIDRFDYELVSFNEASLYRLSGDKIILLPNIGDEGIMFYDQAVFNKFVSEKHFPINGDGSLFADEKDGIERLQTNPEYFIERLSAETQLSLSANDVFSKLPMLSDQVNKIKSRLGSDQLYKKLCVALGIYLGEIVRRKYGSRWKLEQYPIMNPYWIPALEDSNGYSFDLWEPVEDVFLTEGSSDLKVTVEKIIRKYRDGMNSHLDLPDSTMFDVYR